MSSQIANSRILAICLASLVTVCSLGVSARLDGESPAQPSVFRRENLVAWCLVPFDAKQRSPVERAEMLKRLGFTKFAYDWRDPHVPTFEEEIIQCKQHGIEFFAFWGWHEKIEPLIRKYNIHPQIWLMASSPELPTQNEKIETSVRSLEPLVKKTKELGLKLGLYAHGDWGGEPDNLVAVCKYLRQHGDADHVGIVYNFHHGHAHIKDFPHALAAMMPYLLCLDLNGMNATGNPLIMPIGSGEYEVQMMRELVASGYQGRIGIIHHREDLDAEEGLRQNLEGLKRVLESLGDTAALESLSE